MATVQSEESTLRTQRLVTSGFNQMFNARATMHVADDEIAPFGIRG